MVIVTIDKSESMTYKVHLYMFDSNGFRYSPRAGEDPGFTPAQLSLGGYYVHSGDADLSDADTLQSFGNKWDTATQIALVTTIERRYAILCAMRKR